MSDCSWNTHEEIQEHINKPVPLDEIRLEYHGFTSLGYFEGFKQLPSDPTIELARRMRQLLATMEERDELEAKNAKYGRRHVKALENVKEMGRKELEERCALEWESTCFWQEEFHRIDALLSKTEARNERP